ncbi:unnamed protein product [Dibothriocephalus latus]|uniref:Uncharacterized protein n=1 Tax=Dibothriocephalus latus TaxID=60516 RepID=A0A3P6V2E5_DIBLA|nr:unnamed protein product [Dibothriocephalus latus]
MVGFPPMLQMEEYVKKFEAYMKSGSRHAIYPWTVTARIRQFPYLWYYRNNHFVKCLRTKESPCEVN